MAACLNGSASTHNSHSSLDHDDSFSATQPSSEPIESQTSVESESGVRESCGETDFFSPSNHLLSSMESCFLAFDRDGYALLLFNTFLLTF